MKNYILIALTCLCFNQAMAQTYEIHSPSKKIKVQVNLDERIHFSVALDNQSALEKSQIAMDFMEGVDFGVKPKVNTHTITSHSSFIYPEVPHKDAEIKDAFVELTLKMKGNYQLKFRAYDDGVAYQFIDHSRGDRKVISEEMSLNFPQGTKSFFPEEQSMYSHNERLYVNKEVNTSSSEQFCSLPVLFQTNGINLLFTETALHDYPGMFIQGTGNNTVDAIFPKMVLETEDPNTKYADRSQLIKKEADYIASTSGKREYPWRVFIVSDNDETLIESNLTFQLSKPSKIESADWIKPGKVAWDWYNANNIYGVDFESGLNTNTYKYYIDFAAANDIEYVIFDEGWTKSTTDILDFNPEMDVKGLIDYGNQKGVGIILWVLWKPLDANLDAILETYARWGAKGIKVDYMQRNDQYMVNSYQRISEKCADLKLLVDFHGAFKPSGLRRMYPNVVSYEGVKGAENNKWSDVVTPRHNVTIPFIRMAAGPMDYTPGSMNNAHTAEFSKNFNRPMSQGTRAHQVAMYVVYESPLQMLSDSPSRYYKEQETTDFITQIPTVWDETIVLDGAVGEFVAIARRKGTKWYVGAMTGKDSREMDIDLSFLPSGKYAMQQFMDGPNADRFAEDYSVTTQTVDAESSIPIKMAAGGGWSAIISVM